MTKNKKAVNLYSRSDATGIMDHLEPNQFDNLLSSGEKSVVMFYADWCPFCQRFKPVFESVTPEQAKSAISYKTYGAKVNDDENPLWDRFSINVTYFDLCCRCGKISCWYYTACLIVVQCDLKETKAQP